MRRPIVVSASIGAALILSVSTVLSVGGKTAVAQQTSAPALAMQAPPVFNASAARHYRGVTLTFLGDSVGGGHTRDVALTRAFTRATGVRFRIIEHPAKSDESYSLVARNFSSHSSAIDVMMLDVVWPGAFGSYLVNLKQFFTRGAIAKQDTNAIANDTISGRLVAMPWFGDYGILYYRSDLLKKYGYSSPPTTWGQLGQMSAKIQAGEQKTNSNFYGFVFQGNAYEGLTCNALEWLASTGGGTYITNGKVNIDNKTAAGMLNLVRSWVGTIAPRGVTSYTEEETRLAFDNGNAAFMRNWPYAYSLSTASKVAGKFNVTVLPHAAGHKPVGTLGGWQLGVSKYSKHIQAAVEFLRYMTSPSVQKFDAITNSNVPTIPSVSSAPGVVRTNPYLKPNIIHVRRVTRPSRSLGPNYLAGSQAIYQGINQILNGADANSVLPGVQQRLQQIVSRSHG